MDVRHNHDTHGGRAVADADATDTSADADSSKQDDDVVDAEFEEVKDDEKK